jgi:hypothetical protein
MNQRFAALQQLGEEIQRLSEAAEAADVKQHSRRNLSPAWLRARIPRLTVLVSTPVIVMAIALAVVISSSGNGHPGASRLTGAEAALASEYVILTTPQNATARAAAASGPAAALNQAIFDYPILARPQSPAARGGGGSGPARFLTGISGLNLISSMGSLHFHLRTVGWAPYRNIPSLTREVTVAGVRVWFFVVYHPLTKNLPKVVVTGNWRRGAARFRTRSYLTRLRQQVNSTVGYQLWVRVGDHGTPQPIAPRRVLAARATPAGMLLHPGAAVAGADGYISTETATLDGPHGTIVAIVPRNVARISWIWPRDFESSSLSFLPRLVRTSAATDNVAVLDAPWRYRAGGQFSPQTVVYYGMNGGVLARYSDPQNNTLQSERTSETRSTPAPETELSRRAERDPSTPNRVLVLPDVTRLQPYQVRGRRRPLYQLDPEPMIVFNALLNHRNYYARVSGGPRPGCVENPSSRLVARRETQMQKFFGGHFRDQNVRGSTYTRVGPVIVNCPGTYTVSVSVLNSHGLPYKPFARVKLTVRGRR